MFNRILTLLAFSAIYSNLTAQEKRSFIIASPETTAQIIFDKNEAQPVHTAARLFADDVYRVTSQRPELRTVGDSGYQLKAGTLGVNKDFDKECKEAGIDTDKLRSKWEAYVIKAVTDPQGKKNILFVAGSDARGTAHGLMELSRRIGVSPWYWWTDVQPEKKEVLEKPANLFVEDAPDVKFRGIFINDEDWGLQPWAAKTFEPETGDIGPKTYKKVFELLLRLKANTIWPAMHPSTRAFFHYPGNAVAAKEYGIIVGTSHAEPMLRNNVDEWGKSERGDFNYQTNKEQVYAYWEERVKESKGLDAFYTLGMRGVHDSGMEGVESKEEAVAVLEGVIKDQRGLLKKYLDQDVEDIPQAFTAYKEVLDIYDTGLELPEDVTIVWPDDNYGYIRRLNNAGERKRQGGTGVYYHASYWGRPHDYLWLSTTHPSLIREEMVKAYATKADRMWVLNVGDIKPLEYNIHLFLDMAYNIAPFQESGYVKEHLQQWAAGIFGDEKAAPISRILWEYYDLAFERRPEFMGWSRTEPVTPTHFTGYNHFYFGDEAQRRLDRYGALEQKVKKLRSQESIKNADAFYQLVYYPVAGAALMNKKFLYRDKSYLYAQQNRMSAFDYAQMSKEAYDKIVEETNYYNNQLAGGKWNGIMSMKPRNLPVYREPDIPEVETNAGGVWAIAPEGLAPEDSSYAVNGELRLPAFTPWGSRQYFIDLYLTGSKPVSWKASASASWIRLSERKGKLTGSFGKKEHRLWVAVNWSKFKEMERESGTITFKGAGKVYKVEVEAHKPSDPELASFEGFVESNGYVSIFAENFSRKQEREGRGWGLVEGLGHSGNSLISLPLDIEPSGEEDEVIKGAPAVGYDFYTFSTAAPKITVSTLPTHPVNNNYRLRYGVSIDDGPVQIVDFRTFGRSEEWKENVLENRADREVEYPELSEGKHTLKIYMIDPGVILDRITIDLGGLKKAYSTIPETK